MLECLLFAGCRIAWLTSALSSPPSRRPSACSSCAALECGIRRADDDLPRADPVTLDPKPLAMCETRPGVREETVDLGWVQDGGLKNDSVVLQGL